MNIGDRFPDFELKDENGESFSNRSLEGVRYIIYFYSKDGTAGCTKEAQEFNKRYAKLMMMNVPVIGVSKDSPESHRKFREKNGLRIKLLSDPSHSLMENAGVWGKKMNYGKEYEGTIRSTFLVGKDGIVEEAWKNIKVAGHAGKVHDTVKRLFDQ
jgi:Peroxiredoxin